MSSDDFPLPSPPPTCAFCRWTRALTGARVVVVKSVVGGGGAPCPHPLSPRVRGSALWVVSKQRQVVRRKKYINPNLSLCIFLLSAQ